MTNQQIPGPSDPHRLPVWALAASTVLFAGLIGLLVTVPYHFPHDPSVASAASDAGYNNGVAFIIVFVWTAVVVAFFFAARALSWLSSASSSAASVRPTAEITDDRTLLWERIGVVAFFLALYFPLILARAGPFVEDHIFLNLLYRMHCGQVPYRDFEFLYGPLMLYPLYFWTKIFGLSLASYYSFLSLVEAAQFLILVVVLQRFVPDRRSRYLVFLLLFPFLFDTLMGLNWNGMRRLVPVLVMLAVAVKPNDKRIVTAASMFLGLQLAYSHDYGVAALLAIVGMYGFLFVTGRSMESVRGAVTIIVGAVGVWALASFLVLQGNFPAYLATATSLVDRFTAGEAAFRFYWTANSLALFAMLGIACLVIGKGLADSRRGLLEGDRFLLVTVAFAIVTLKSGLNRADFWHLNAPFLGLVFAFLLPLATGPFSLLRPLRAVALVCVVVASSTYLLGSAPSGSFLAQGYVRGVKSLVTGQGTDVSAAVARRPPLGWQGRELDPDIVGLAAFVAQPQHANRPVFFYSDTWSLGKQIGVCKADYLNDDFLYSDESGFAAGEYLVDNPDALVIIKQPVYDRLFGFANPDSIPEFRRYYRDTVTKRLASVLSTVHLREVETELRVRDARWRRTVGVRVRAGWSKEAEFGNLLVLAPNEAVRQEP